MHIAGMRADKLPIPKFHSFAEYVAVYSQGLLQPFDRDSRFSWRMSHYILHFPLPEARKEAVSYLGHVGRPSGSVSE